MKITQDKCVLSFNCSKFILNFATNTSRRTEDKSIFNLECLILTYPAEFEYKYIQRQIGSAPKLRFRRWTVLLKCALGSQLCLSLKHWQNYSNREKQKLLEEILSQRHTVHNYVQCLWTYGYESRRGLTIWTHITTIRKPNYHNKDIANNNKKHDKEQTEYEITDRYELRL